MSILHYVRVAVGLCLGMWLLAGAGGVQALPLVGVTSEVMSREIVTGKKIAVQVNEDFEVEDKETFSVLPGKTAGTNLSIDDAGTGAIADEALLLFVSDAQAIEGDEDGAGVEFEVSLSHPIPAGGADVQAVFVTADGTATAADSDYETASGPVVFQAGGASKQTVQVAVNGDTVAEADESFQLRLSLPLLASGGAVVADGIGVATIVNDDSPVVPQFVIHNENPGHQVIEGAGNDAVFSVTLLLPDPPPAGMFDVDVELLDASASAGADFVFATQTLHLSAAEDTAIVSIPVLDDPDVEGDEHFSLVLTNASAGPTMGSPDSASVDLVDDESLTAPVLAVSANADSIEEHAGIAEFKIRLLPADAAGEFEVVFATQTGGAGAASAGSDYVAVIDEPVVLSAAMPQITVSVPIIDDAGLEGDETLSVRIYDPPAGTVLGTTDASTTIIDNDSYQQTVSIDDVTIVEGNAGGQDIAVLTVSLSTPIPPGFGPVGLRFSTQNGSATGNLDFMELDQTLSFEEGGAMQQPVEIPVYGDDEYEGDESFIGRLDNVSGVNATLGDDDGTVSIMDDDPLLGVRVEDVAVPEGDSGSTPAQVRISLAEAIPAGRGPIGVKYQTMDGSARISEGDYSPVFHAFEFVEGGARERLIDVAVNGDTVAEPDEAFQVRLTEVSGAGAVLMDDTAQITIVNDDHPAAPEFVIASVEPGQQVYEGATPAAAFQVSLLSPEPPLPGDFAVTVSSVAGSAEADVDYAAVLQTIVLSAAQPTGIVFVDILDDALDEGGEDFSLVLSDATYGAGIGSAGTASVTIVDDETLVTPTLIVSADLPGASEGAGTAAFTVTLLPHDAAGPFRVGFETQDGAGGASAATVGVDYQPVADASIVLGNGANSETVSVPLIDDNEVEGGETLSVHIFSLTSGATSAVDTASVLILDNDAPPGDGIFSDGFEN